MCLCVTAVFLCVRLSRHWGPHTWSFSLSLSPHPLPFTLYSFPPLLSSVSVSPLFPVLCFKAEACVTHSTWRMKPLSCLEVAAAAAESERGKNCGEENERRGVCVWTWGVDARNEVFFFLCFNCSKKTTVLGMILLLVYAFRAPIKHKKAHTSSPPLTTLFLNRRADVICWNKTTCVHIH